MPSPFGAFESLDPDSNLIASAYFLFGHQSPRDVDANLKMYSNPIWNMVCKLPQMLGYLVSDQLNYGSV